MSDGKKSCLGFTALILGLGLAAVSLLVGGIGQLVLFLGGDSLGINLKTGLIAAVVVFALLFISAIYFFVSIKEWAWLPAIAGGVYAILPDLVLGPEDDVLAMIAGVGISGLLSYLDYRRGKKVEITE